MYDPEFDEFFNKRTKDTKWWDGGEPIWVTARKQGLKSAAFFWVGSETKIRGFRPNFYVPYNESIPFKNRVDTVLQWFANDVDLALLYFNEPDSTGHKFGPNSPEVRAKVKEMDDIVGYIVDKFNENKLWNTVNVIITSDHGMAEIDYAHKHVDLMDYIDMSAVDKIPTYGPSCNILPKAGMEMEIINNLTNVLHIKVYKKDDIPERWHYRNHRRILPVLVVAEEGWLVLKVKLKFILPTNYIRFQTFISSVIIFA
jgi:predicted AlkP superfamily pyrophosphatase or phosphodiesterase